MELACDVSASARHVGTTSRSGLVVAMVVLNVLAACGGSGSATSSDAASDPSSEPSRSSATARETPVPTTDACPNSSGGQCLGDLEGGRPHRTQAFIPQIAYTTPAGWSNMEDLPGNFLLLPPDRDLEGVDAGRVDYLGVYSGATVAAEDCSPEPVPGVGVDPDAIVRAISERPGLDVSTPHDVVVGGLEGLTVDIAWAPGTAAGCEVTEDLTIIPLIIGVGPASLEHAQAPGYLTRLYVLDNGRSNVIIEVSDVRRDKRPFEYEQVLAELRFLSS